VLWGQTRLLGQSFSDTTNSQQYVTHILTTFLQCVSDYNRTHALFQLDSATSHRTNALLRQYFWWQNNAQGIVASRSPDLNPCKFCLWDMWKDKEHSNNRYMEGDLKTSSIQDVVSLVSPAEIHCSELFHKLGILSLPSQYTVTTLPVYCHYPPSILSLPSQYIVTTLPVYFLLTYIPL
jgi:hypothetical protein